MENFVEAKFNCLHALADGNWRIWIREKKPEFSSTVLSAPSALKIQIYGFCRPCDVDVLTDKMSACSVEALLWMRANRLWEIRQRRSAVVLVWSSSAPDTSHVSSDRRRRRAASLISPQPQRVHHSDVAMRSHITATVRSCFSALRQLRSV